MPKQGFKSGKSSKTARVLNLLTDPNSIEPSAGPGAPQSAADGAKLADDRRTQENIRGALEGALEKELSEAAMPVRPPRRPRGARDAAPETSVQEPEAEPAREGREAESKEPAADDSAAFEPVFPVAEAADTPLENALNELRAAGEEKPDEFICFNVMQTLVEDKAGKYIKMFGLCDCNRCRIDVVALALSNLPPKYVVAKPHELIPRLSMYEQKFSVIVVTQVMSACRKVLDRPHHQRKEG